MIHGADADDQSGRSVSSAGDINGDGFDDLIIGAPYADGPGAAPGTRNDAGDSYVVFGQAGGFGAAIDLVNVAAGIGGFVIHGADADDHSGRSVSSAGDINGDGFDDLIIGAHFADGPGAAPGTRNDAGDSYVVFGQAGGFGAAIDLVNVAAGIGGFVIHGADADDQSGLSVSSAGDINGDGFDDLIIGAHYADGPGAAPGTRSDAGDSYVVFGQAGGFGAAIDLRECRRRHRRLRDPRRGCGRSLRHFGLLRRRHRRRRLRRPHHRGIAVPTVPARRRARAAMPATATCCSARRPSAARSTTSPISAATARRP